VTDLLSPIRGERLRISTRFLMCAKSRFQARDPLACAVAGARRSALNAAGTRACAASVTRSALRERTTHRCLNTVLRRENCNCAPIKKRFTEVLKLQFKPHPHHRQAWSAAQAPWLRVVRTAMCAASAGHGGPFAGSRIPANGALFEFEMTRPASAALQMFVVTRARLDRSWATIPGSLAGSLGCVCRAGYRSRLRSRSADARPIRPCCNPTRSRARRSAAPVRRCWYRRRHPIARSGGRRSAPSIPANFRASKLNMKSNAIKARSEQFASGCGSCRRPIVARLHRPANNHLGTPPESLRSRASRPSPHNFVIFLPC
jgi:hypothetical protein